MCECGCGTKAEKRLADAMVQYAKDGACEVEYLKFSSACKVRTDINVALREVIAERAPKVTKPVWYAEPYGRGWCVRSGPVDREWYGDYATRIQAYAVADTLNELAKKG